MMPPAMSQAPFYYYSPESKNEVRQHGHFSPQQPMQHQQQQHIMYPMVPTLPSTPVYSRPNSANSQPPTLYSNGPAVMTPTASPQPISHKSAMMLEPEMYENSYFPSTPPLSTSGSTIGSPNSCEVLQTPMNPMFSGLDGFDGVKECLEPVEASVLDWSNCGSPPMTPGKLVFSFSSKSLLCAPPIFHDLSITSNTVSYLAHFLGHGSSVLRWRPLPKSLLRRSDMQCAVISGDFRANRDWQCTFNLNLARSPRLTPLPATFCQHHRCLLRQLPTRDL